MLDLIHDYDWYASGDTGRENYLKAKAKFKKKWMDNRGVRVKRIVDETIQRAKDEYTNWEGECGYTKFCPGCGANMRGGADNG